MIISYFNQNLWTKLSKLCIGYSLDLSQTNIDVFLTSPGTEEFQENLFLDADEGTYDHFQGKLTNPNGSRYNALVGLTELNELVFIREVSISYTDVIIKSIIYNLYRVYVERDIPFDITEDTELLTHNHDYIETEFSPESNYNSDIDGFTDTYGQITQSRFNKDIVTNLVPDLNECLFGPEGKKISEISGVYNVDFRYESMPSTILNELTTESIFLNPGNYSFTYRGNSIAYKTDDPDKPYSIRSESLERFSVPASLITEKLAVIGKDLYSYDGTTWKYIEGSDKVDLVLYRSAFKINNGKLIRII